MNGLLAPDLYLSRDRTYAVVVETGLGTSRRGTFHPVYITTDQEGGYQTKTELQRRVREEDNFIPLMRMLLLRLFLLSMLLLLLLLFLYNRCGCCYCY